MIIAFLILGIIKKFIITDIDIVFLALGPVLLTITGTVMLLNQHYKLIALYKEHSTAVKAISVASATYIGYKASAMTDASIAEFTMTNASNFPQAQNIIKICATVATWAFVAVACSLVFYGVISIAAMFKIFSFDNFSNKNRQRRNFLGGRATKTNEESKEIIKLGTIIVGTTMLVLAPSEYARIVKADDINTAIKNLIVETSFHLDPKICGVKTPKDSEMSLLPFKEAAIAIPDEKLTYRFVVIECKRIFDDLSTLVGDDSHNNKTPTL